LSAKAFPHCRRYSVTVVVGVTAGLIVGLIVTIGDMVGFMVMVGFTLVVVLVVVIVAEGAPLLSVQPINRTAITIITSITKISFFTFSPSFCFIVCTFGQKYFD
jgi:hypothetical protein